MCNNSTDGLEQAPDSEVKNLWYRGAEVIGRKKRSTKKTAISWIEICARGLR